MITVENHVGRLIEVRVRSSATLADIVTMGETGLRFMTKLGRPAVFCSDMREATQLTATVSDQFVEIYRRANANVERTAILVEERAVYREAFERIVQKAGLDARRVFTSLPDAARWLDERLTPDERRRLRQFVAGLAATTSAAPPRRPPRS